MPAAARPTVIDPQALALSLPAAPAGSLAWAGTAATGGRFLPVLPAPRWPRAGCGATRRALMTAAPHRRRRCSGAAPASCWPVTEVTIWPCCVRDGRPSGARRRTRSGGSTRSAGGGTGRLRSRCGRGRRPRLSDAGDGCTPGCHRSVPEPQAAGPKGAAPLPAPRLRRRKACRVEPPRQAPRDDSGHRRMHGTCHRERSAARGSHHSGRRASPRKRGAAQDHFTGAPPRPHAVASASAKNHEHRPLLSVADRAQPLHGLSLGLPLSTAQKKAG